MEIYPMDKRSMDRIPTLLIRGTSLLITLGLVGLIWSSCGGSDEFNFFQPFSDPLHKDEPKVKLESAKIKLDKKEYAAAASILEPMTQNETENSNETRLLYVAATLGQANLDLWSIIKNFLDSQQSSEKKSSGGLDSFLNSMSSSVLGTGEEKTQRIAIVNQAIALLRTAPHPEDKSISNTSCLLAGILALPTFVDAKDAMTASLTALQSIKSSASSNGSSCPNISLLDTALTNAASASARMSLVMLAATGCSFLNIAGSASDLNSLEKQLAKLIAAADKGCASLPTCSTSVPDCQSYFPQCVQDLLKVGSSSAVAGDKQLASCELTLHCSVDGSCFD
jgi:hypothetical protein